MTTELELQLTQLKHGDHVCPIYESKAEQLAAAVPFIKQGLARNERCLLIVDDRTAEEIAEALAAAGLDVARERGALWLPHNSVTYFRSGHFDPDDMIDFLRTTEAQALAEGFSGLRIVGEMTWALGPEIGNDRLIEFEVLVNKFFENSRSIGLCQYHRPRFDPAVIHDVLRTHPVVILGDLVCPNPYYEPPDLVLPGVPEASAEFKARRVDWWIKQLKQARAADREREQAEEILRQTKQRLADAQRVAQIGSWERDLRTNQIFWSDELYRLFGLEPGEGELSYEKFLSFVMPEDLANARQLVEQAVRERKPFAVDYRVETPDRTLRIVHDQGKVILDDAGNPVRLVGTAQDVTERRRAEKTAHEYVVRLQALSRQLLEVQESERRHLARELHDEVGQLLTGLRLLLKPNGEGAAKSRFEQARALVDELLEKIRALSFDLRPAVLDQLGLLPALLGLIERYTEQTRVLVDFKHRGIEQRFAPDVETTAYRIVQESLTNVARHAGVAGAIVRVWASTSVLSAQIEDRGRGFDPEKALASPRSGGLTGMRQRVALLAGHLNIESHSGGGTQITAELPLHTPIP
jgi:PAS domain S-box-containing protein